MIRIGTSGWHYAHWKGLFYPPEVKSPDFLAYYSARYPTVEINNSFYRLPTESTLRTWRAIAPGGFIFAAKASNWITHKKKLLDPAEPVANVLGRLELLGEHLGPILFQLPGRWHVDAERLRAFLPHLPPRHRYAFELRDPTWFTDEVFALLREHRVAHCLYDFDRRQSPLELTSDWVYVRLHGPWSAYAGSYDTETLSVWADRAVAWDAEGRDVYVYFDNDGYGFALQNASELTELVEARLAEPRA